MKNNKFDSRNIPIKDLHLWDENPRFPDKYFKSSEEDLIKYFVTKKELKIKELAEAIVEEFDLPQIEKIVVYEYKKKLITLEGNRRLVIYKLLSNPSLTTDTVLRSFFEKIRNKVNIDNNFQLEALTTDDIEQGLRFIRRKHIKSNNEVGWGTTERAHYNTRRGNAKKIEQTQIGITKKIKELDIPEVMKEKVLGPGYVTNLFRILDSSPAKDLFGFKLEENGELSSTEKDFNEKLKVITLNVLQKKDSKGGKLNSRTLNTNEQKYNYLKSISPKDFKNATNEIDRILETDIFGNENLNLGSSKSKKSKPFSTIRKYLIPKTCILVIDNPRINNIYLELRNNLLLDDSINAVPNAVGVLFRVFLEISLDHYLSKEGITIDKRTKITDKITKTADHMYSSKIATQPELGNIRKVTNKKVGLLSIENFHEYVHSTHYQPSPSDLKLKWDNLEEFFEILWDYLNMKSTSKIKK
ncbi:hypothetical protein E3V33_02575 [Candidatus Marinimicrobia bacterium MT.SAG.4]|nr:hypothetical protein E3V33_02575 [Candidatus Marinimicrobia bacterium MT.SAG.4]